MFNRERGWQGLKGDVKTFCKLLQFEPDSQQLHYLLRVQNAHEGACRLGLPPMDETKAFQIIATAMFFRALVHFVPSYLFYEHKWSADKWVNSMRSWGAQANYPLLAQIQVSKQRRYLVANDIHVCHVVGPWTKDNRFIPGRQDIILPDFDDTPTDRILRICELTEGSILYIPHNGTLAEPEDRREAPDG